MRMNLKLTRLVKMMHTSFEQWRVNRDKRGGQKSGQPRDGAPERPFTIETKGPFTPTGGVDSFSTMMRAEKSAFVSIG